MREVPAGLLAAWRGGDYTGSNRPMGRITIQKGKLGLHQFSHNLYSSYLFNNPNVPKELPNLRSISWERSTDTEVATCTIQLWNTRPLPLGQQPIAGDLDLPGWYTPTRGVGSFSSQWGQEVNEWLGLLLPDNIVRTYEGYGFDPNVCPSADPNLMISGTWLIDEVDIDAEGKTINLQCSDFGRLLMDQLAMKPIVPERFEPLTFSKTERRPGIQPPQEIVPSASWAGPSLAPTGVAVTPGSKSAAISWDPMDVLTEGTNPLPAPPGTGLYAVGNATVHYYDEVRENVTVRRYLIRFEEAGVIEWYYLNDSGSRTYVENFYGSTYAATDYDATVLAENGGVPGRFADVGLYTEGEIYELVGQRVYLNGDALPLNVPAGTSSATIEPLQNGVVYSASVAGIYQVIRSGARKTTDLSAGIFFSPRSDATVGVQPGTVEADTQADGTPTDGYIRWQYTSDGRQVQFNVLVYKGDQASEERFGFVFDDVTTNGTDFADVNTGITDLHEYNVQVIPLYDAQIGPGGLLFSSVEPAYYGSSPAGEPPEPPEATLQATSTSSVSKNTSSLSVTEVTPTLVQTSNFPYHGTGTTGSDGTINGHSPSHALDRNPETYWISVGNSRPDVGYAFEWVEGAVSGSVAGVRITVPSVAVDGASQMMCWVSVKVGGKWVQHSPGDVIPYDADDPIAKNGGNIPYVKAAIVPIGGVGFRIDLPQEYPGATNVRVTFSNLFDSGFGTFRYRAALAEFLVLVASTTVDQGSDFESPAPTLGEVTDTQGNTIKAAEILGGAGEFPGEYDDYTDIVKLLCAWAGFFWPEDGTVLDCDGASTAYNFGNAPFNLGPNIDPVLGGDYGNGGRVWGDFEQSGTAGVADLTPSIFDKKPLIEGINHVKEILGFIFHIDEEGSVVWRSPNIWSLGNWVLGSGRTAGRTAEILTIDERVNLLSLGGKLSGRNLREKIFIGTPDAKLLGVADGWNPNPTGLRRVAGWTDQNFKTQEECQLMAELTQLRRMFSYRTSRWTIPAYPGLQINDQVRIYERTMAEGYLHYVKTVSSSLDLSSGEYTFSCESHWLGESPFDFWVFDPNALSQITKTYLQDAREIDLNPQPSSTPVRRAVPSTYTFNEVI